MNTQTRRKVALAAMAGAFLTGTLGALAAGEDSRSAATSRAKDPAWKPATQEVAAIQLGDARSPGALKNFCLNSEGNILACFVPKSAGETPGIRVYSATGKLLKTLPLEIKPVAVSVAKDGSIFAAGDGRLLKLDAAGKVLASAPSPVAAVPVEITKEMEEMIKRSRRTDKDPVAAMKATLEKRRAEVTGLAVSDGDVFLSVPAPNEFTYQVYRFDLALQNPKLVVQKLRGCCGQMDIQARGATLWIPHNGRHSVEARDRDGNEVSKFGTRGKVKAEDFGGCCEPKNMRTVANGDVLVAESGPPTCIKRYSASGKFLGVVALIEGKAECLRVTVEASADGRTYYLLDTKRDAIRVFKAKG